MSWQTELKAARGHEQVELVYQHQLAPTTWAVREAVADESLYGRDPEQFWIMDEDDDLDEV